MSSDSGSKENTFEDVADRTPEIPDTPDEPKSSKSSKSSNSDSDSDSDSDSESNSSNSNSSDSNSSNSDSNTSAEVPADIESPPKVNIVENTSIKTKKPLSDAALKLQEERRRIFDGDLKEAYIVAFGDEKKAPKPKFLEATALVKVRKEQGENAYRKKIQEYVERDRDRQGQKPTARARTVKAKPMTVVSSHSVSHSAERSGKSNHLVKSIHEMAHSMRKHLSDIESAAVQLAKAQPHTPSPTKKARKPRSNIGKTHKKKGKVSRGSAVKLDS